MFMARKDSDLSRQIGFVLRQMETAQDEKFELACHKNVKGTLSARVQQSLHGDLSTTSLKDLAQQIHEHVLQKCPNGVSVAAAPTEGEMGAVQDEARVQDEVSVIDDASIEHKEPEMLGGFPEPPSRAVEGPLQQLECRDKLGRLHINAPRNGPTKLVHRACLFHPVTAANLWEERAKLFIKLADATGRTFFRVTGDGGPDYWVISPYNHIYAWWALKRADGKIDGISLDCYSSKKSKYNDIEHFWSPNSNSLTGVTLSAIATGDTCAPCNLPKAEYTSQQISDKEAEVMDNALAELQTFARRRTFNTHIISSAAIAAKQDNEIFTQADHDLIGELLCISKKKIQERPDLLALLQEWIEAVAHSDLRKHYYGVYKCDEESPCEWCRSRPWIARSVYKFLKARSMKMLGPVPSADDPGHFEPWLVAKTIPPEQLPKPDENLPSAKKAGLGCCGKCNSYVFTSAAAQKKHNSMIHNPPRATEEEDISGDEDPII